MTSFFGVVDLLAILPTYLSLFLPGGQFLLVIRVLHVLHIFRVLKLNQFLNEANILLQALALVIIILGYGIIAVPNGIVTVEIGRASSPPLPPGISLSALWCGRAWEGCQILPLLWY